jgi:superfamily II DNA/RNA helicase
MQIKQLHLEKTQMAIRWLAGRCDFATSSDGEGFSGTDAVLGHALARKDVWSPREMLTALGMIVKYKKQISVGNLDISGLDAVQRDLVKELGVTRVRRCEMVSGDIRVVDNLIILKTGYSAQLVSEIKELVGRIWDGSQNSCSLSAENAVAVEDIAQRYGLKLHKHSDWARLVSTRRVESFEGAILIHGVNARQIVRSLPNRTGKPELDEREFTAINVVDDTCIAIPLKSWIIRDAMLWLTGLDERDANYARLSWAINGALQFLGDAYPTALKEERANYSQASALTLPQDSQTKIGATLPAEMVKRLMPHQWVAVHVLLNCPQAFLADQQGLGKTVEILAALESASAFPAVVLVPATALLNWRDEVLSWLPHRKVCVLGGGVGKRDQGAPLEGADIVIINYESFAKNADSLALWRPKSLVADEAQYLKGYDSAHTKAVKEFCKTSGVKRIIAATGTPVMNRSSELLTLLTLLPDLLTELGGFHRFASRYCRATQHMSSWNSWWDYSGAANLGELANRIRETGRFVRRDKADVLVDLAAKRNVFQTVDICNRAEYNQAATDFKEWLKTQISIDMRSNLKNQTADDGDLSNDENSRLELVAAELGLTAAEIAELRMDRAEGIRRMTALRQLAGAGKTQAAVQWIKQNVKDEKLIIFAVHIEVQEALVAALSSDVGPPLTINGDMSAKARHDAIFRFQNDPKSRFIVCSLKASQTAITLTAAQRVLMVELDWTPSALEQAEDRAHRIGQIGEVIVTYLNASDTLDDRMAVILNQKRLKIGVLTAAAAPHGYRKDGVPRLQPPGPGRPRLDPVTRKERRKASKSGWQARNAKYMRDYMRASRLKKKEKDVQRSAKDLSIIESLGLSGMQREVGGPRGSYREGDYQQDLDRARAELHRMQEILNRALAC